MSAWSEADYVISEVTSYIKELMSEDIYGFIEHMGIAAPGSRIEYIGKNKDFTPLTVTMGGGYSLGDWASFPQLVKNKPFMVNANGYADYQLYETDYTKKADGTTASDVANTSYAGAGAFSWLQKIYKMEYVVGTDRYVLFSQSPRDGFEPAGFVDPDGNELEGIWIPMFYGSEVSTKLVTLSGTQPVYNKTTAQEKDLIDAVGARAVFLGGAGVKTISDLLIMWAKTTHTQAAYGYGNCAGYDASLSPTYGVKENAVVGGGQFYGTGSDDKKSLNKILHSVVLGSWQQWQRDPYTICVSGRMKVSKNYKYDVTGATYEDTGVQYPETASGVYPNKFASEKGYGDIPVPPYGGTSETGGCDGFWVNPGITAVAIRFGKCGNDVVCGFRALSVNDAATNASWGLGASLLLLPPAGVSPDTP